MSKHMPATWRMARLGLAAGIVAIISHLMDLTRGRATHDRYTVLATIPMMVVLFGLGGLVYSIIVSRVNRDTVPTPAIRAAAGLAAGILVSALIAVPMLRIAEDGAAELFLLIGALCGVTFGLAAGIRRPSAPFSAVSPRSTPHD